MSPRPNCSSLPMRGPQLSTLHLCLAIYTLVNIVSVSVIASVHESKTITGPLHLSLGYMKSDVQENESMYNAKTRQLLLNKVKFVPTDIHPIKGAIKSMDKNILRELDESKGKRWALLQAPPTIGLKPQTWANTPEWRHSWRQLIQNQVQAELDEEDDGKPFKRIAIAVLWFETQIHRTKALVLVLCHWLMLTSHKATRRSRG